MTALNINAYKQLLDALLCMGFGIILGFAYHIFTLVIYRANKIIVYTTHVLFFSVVGLVVFCFVIGKTSLATMRWYLGAGFLVGVLAYYWCFASLVKNSTSFFVIVIKTILSPFVFVFIKTIKEPLFLLWDYLQKRHMLMYNQRKQKKKQKRQLIERSENDEQGAISQKDPIKAYTQT